METDNRHDYKTWIWPTSDKCWTDKNTYPEEREDAITTTDSF